VSPTEAATQIIPAAGPDVAVSMTPTRARGPTPATPTTPRPHVTPPGPSRKRAPVLAIAAIAVVVVGAGGFAALQMLGGGNGSVPPLDTTTVALGDSQPAVRRPSGERPPQPGGGGERSSGGSEATPPPVDSAAIAGELGDLFRRLPDTGPADAALLARLEAIMNDDRMPVKLRADAAAFAGQGYFGGGDHTRACDRIRRALDLAPGGRVYEQMSSMFECR
jgi:hypothetical protein